MHTLLDAASYIAKDIESTRLRLANLEQALASLTPLITIDAATSLPYGSTQNTGAVEDAAIVEGSTLTPQKLPKQKNKKAKPVVAKAPAKEKLPATGADLWLRCAGSEAFSAKQLTSAALTQLGLDERSRSALSNRARAWITLAIKQGTVLLAESRDGLHFYQLA